MATHLSNEKYKTIFKQLTKAYYDGTFDETVRELLQFSEFDKMETMKLISVLCGVDVNIDDENFIPNLKKAITNYKVKENVVNKIFQCNDCEKSHHEKTKCQSVCPFDAIVEEPLKKDMFIDNHLCIHCGMCVEVCDSGAIRDKIEFLPLLDLLQNNTKVIAIVAPAIAGQFGDSVTLDQLRAAFIKAGFFDMMEVAFAADMLTIKEAVEFDHHVKAKGDLLITSCCCPMWVSMLKKVYHDLVQHVSPSVSPMIAMGKILKQLNPDVKVVFIGPCVAKKAEAKDKDLVGIIDFVLTFEEIGTIFEILNIIPQELTGVPSLEYASRGGRLYATTGGVSTAVSEAVEELFPDKIHLMKTVQANGVPACKELLNKVQRGEVTASFMEGMGCVGGCVGGPKTIISTDAGRKAVTQVAMDSSIKVSTNSDIMMEVLKRIGIESLEDFKHPEKIEILERNF